MRLQFEQSNNQTLVNQLNQIRAHYFHEYAEKAGTKEAAKAFINPRLS